MEFIQNNITQFTNEQVLSSGSPISFVTITDCKSYVADVTRSNHVLMGLIVLLGIAILLYLNRNWIIQKIIKSQTKKVIKDEGSGFMSQVMQNFETMKDLEEQKEKEQRNNLVDLPNFKKEDK